MDAGNLCNAKLENVGNKKSDIEVFGWCANTNDPLYNNYECQIMQKIHTHTQVMR